MNLVYRLRDILLREDGYHNYPVSTWVTNMLLHAIEFINPYKDRGLAQELHQMAELYDPRPANTQELH